MKFLAIPQRVVEALESMSPEQRDAVLAAMSAASEEGLHFFAVFLKRRLQVMHLCLPFLHFVATPRAYDAGPAGSAVPVL